MKNEKESNVIDELSRQFHRERILLNNPVVMQGMGLAPIVVVATSVENAWMLSVAVLLLLTPTRVLASICLRNVKSAFARVIGYVGFASVLYAGVYLLLGQLFGVKILNLGIYLPMLVMEPLVIYRFARVSESLYKAFFKGLRVTLGYAVVILLVGALREFFALGTVYGVVVAEIALLPIAATPAGGFILLGVLCAIWRVFVNQYRKKIILEARHER